MTNKKEKKQTVMKRLRRRAPKEIFEKMSLPEKKT